jgi:8-amino-7-oxononanoate synthase
MAVRLAQRADNERAHLTTISEYLRKRLRNAGFDIAASRSQIVPVILGSNEYALEFARALAREGFAAKAIRPPTVPPGTARLRLSLTANLPTQTVEALADCIIATRERIGIAETLPGR